MSLTASDLIVYRAITNSSELNNGGMMSSNVAITGLQDNIFPDISDVERLSGGTTWRKIFWKNNNIDSLGFRNVFAMLTSYLVGNDIILFCSGSYDDTQSSIQNTTRFYGAATIRIAATPGSSIIYGTLANSSIVPFVTGDSIIINNDVTNEIFDNVTVDVSGSNITIALTAGQTIQNTYNPSNTFISSVLSVPDLVPSYDSLSTISPYGLMNVAEYDIQLINIGTIYQTWPISFYSSSQFTLQGSTLGYVNNGDILHTFSPLNPDCNAPYLTIPTNTWQGTWNIGDTVTFITYPSSIALWFKRIVPAGSMATYNSFTHALRGQATTQ